MTVRCHRWLPDFRWSVSPGAPSWPVGDAEGRTTRVGTPTARTAGCSP
ncbi:hypothetical protein T261_0402 [Streptomyces lydicus]|nr:hypothetical protein T261_0402 [Streptomyces lydicus]